MTGVVLLVVGLWWKFMLGPYMLLISSSPSSAPYVLTGTGAAIALFGLFGCFATCRGHPWMLKLVGLPAYSEFVNKCLTKPFMRFFFYVTKGFKIKKSLLTNTSIKFLGLMTS